MASRNLDAPDRRSYRTVGDLLSWTEGHFRRLGIATPRLDAELLLASVLGVGRLELYTGYGQLVEPDERRRFRELVKRRARREPVAYLLGEKEFYSLAFRVTAAVLIPRPETEHLVDEALDILRPRTAQRPLRVLDLGTGSGNVAISIAVHCPEALVDAVELSPGALAVAEENVRRHGVERRVRLLEGDFFEPLEGQRELYQVIVSNPPYVSAQEMAELMPDVRLHEPREALVPAGSAGGDGLGAYRTIAARVRQFLAPSGRLLVEVGEGQAPEVARMLQAAGLGSRRTARDYGGHDRVVVAWASSGKFLDLRP